MFLKSLFCLLAFGSMNIAFCSASCINARVASFEKTQDELAVWDRLVCEGVVELSGSDAEVRPSFVTLQGVVEQALASELGKGILRLKGVIHTPRPTTALCSRGEISPGLVDASLEGDAERLKTVKARTTMVRDFLHKGGDLYIVYPKGGLELRTEDQQAIYKAELEKHPKNLIDVQLSLEEIPGELVGATYFFDDEEGKVHVFSIQMTQAKDPLDSGHYGLWYGSADHPEIQKRLQLFSDLGIEHVLDE